MTLDEAVATFNANYQTGGGPSRKAGCRVTVIAATIRPQATRPTTSNRLTSRFPSRPDLGGLVSVVTQLRRAC
jgi:hypothetical protein